MKHLFIGYGGRLRPRWQEAFPDALGIPSIEELAPAGSNEPKTLWLDISNTSEKERMNLVVECINTGIPVIVMSSLPNDDEAYEMLRNGAYGYCHNIAAPSQLVEIAQVVEHGGLWVGAEVMRRLVNIANRVAATKPQNSMIKGLGELTAKELEVAKQVAVGATNREIAEELHMSERTVKAHLSAVFDKMDVRDRVQLALTMNNVKLH